MTTFKAVFYTVLMVAGIMMVIPAILAALPVLLAVVGALAIARMLVRVEQRSSKNDSSTPAK